MVKLLAKSYQLANGLWAPYLIVRKDYGDRIVEIPYWWPKGYDKFQTKKAANEFALRSKSSPSKV